MDDLVHHIVRELSFEGDLGCSVSHLENFIKDFYHKTKAQNVDDAYCAFIWSVIVQEPTVRVGVLPPGEHTEVYVAPQMSAQKKATKKTESSVEESPVTLSIVPDAAVRSLDDLKREYCDSLRISVDPKTSFAAITGSHIRPSKLTPMVYTALQLITRGREKGISVVELGKKTGYDQKTCFYLVKQLESLDLVVKIRQAGVGTHFCMHKHFYERSFFWKSVRDEEAVEHSTLLEDTSNTEGLQGDPSKAKFDPIDSRHLSSLPLLRGRIIKLLNSSANYTHPSQNLLITLGFERPTKTDRRFFAVRLAELVKEGIIEKILVPSANTKRYASGKVQCIRLVSKDGSHKQDPERDGIVVLPAETDVDGNDVEEDVEEFQGIVSTFTAGKTDTYGGCRLKANIVIHKQIIDLLCDAGSRGMTLSEISQQLCSFDRRTIELLLQRLEKDPPPLHLLDLGVVAVTETHGRERRHRYYIYQAYRALLEKEKLDDTSESYSSVDLSKAGGFLEVAPELFYKSHDQLINYQDTFRDQENKHKARKRKVTNPILEDGTVKKGRPRKNQTPKLKKVASVAGEGKRKKRKQEESEDIEDDTNNMEQPPAKKRKTEVEQTKAIPKKRARARKKSNNEDEAGPCPQESRHPSQQRSPPSPDAEGATEDAPNSLGESTREPDTTLPINDHRGEVDFNPLDPLRQHGGNQTDRPDVQLVEELSIHTSAPTLPGSSLTPEPPKDNTHNIEDIQVTSSTLPERLDKTTTESTRRSVDPVQQSPRTDPLTSALEQVRQEQSDQRSTDPAAITKTDTPGKRPPDDIEMQPPAKRAKLSKTGPRKTNVSHLRRDNELFHVIQGFGGITVVNVKEFLDAHIALIETLTKAGEPTSAPNGSRLDRRTVDAAIQKLESDGRIKVIKTSLCTATGASRPITIAYVFDMEQEKVNEFLSRISKSSSSGDIYTKIKTVDLDAEFNGNGVHPPPSVSLIETVQMNRTSDIDHERWRKNVKRATQIFSHDDATIRDILQRESTTVSQSYGYLMGRVARARELHLVMLDHFQIGSTRPRMVSLEQRIVHLTYFLRDISIATYCRLLSTSVRLDELDELFQEEQGRQTLLKDLPASIYSGLGIGSSRSRTRLLEILELLCAFKLVTALKPSQSVTPEITCAQYETHPDAFETFPPEMWSSTKTATAPVYWKFNVDAPIFLWALSDTAAPAWKDVPISSHADGLTYWEDLRKACLDSKFATSVQASFDGVPITVSEGESTIGQSLRRSMSWRSSYALSWYQERYLRKFVDSNPLSDEDEGTARIKSMAWVINAPEQVIRQFYTGSQDKRVRELKKARLRAKRGSVPVQAKNDKASLAKKAAERKLQRQQEWDALVAQLHPEPIKKALSSRLKRIRDEYMKAASVRESQKWEHDITHAIREVNLATSKVLSTSAPASAAMPSVVPSHVPPAVVNSSEKSVDELIAQQGPQLSSDKKGSKKNEDEETSQKKRRGRFSWNRDYDELAKDTSAIIKARCRSGQRMEWAAAEQVFPSLPRNSVRQRVDRLSKEPGVESYLRRLEDRWYDLWMQHTGTHLLPDPEPSSVSNFDLVKHLKFLRAHVDKSSLRAGFSQSDVRSPVQLPSTLDQLLRNYDIVDKRPVAPPWDFVWTTVTEEGRERQMFCQAFVSVDEFILSVPTYESESLHVAEAAVKMVLGTPNDSYGQEAGARLLHRIGEEQISTTTINLLNRGVLSKLVRDQHKAKPGRTLKISDTNLNAMGSSLSKELFQDASSLEELAMEEQDVEEEGWREWPLLALDGDMAALVELVSEDKVGFEIDTSQAQAARSAIEWNSKKADDDDIETSIQIRIRDLSWMDMWSGGSDMSPRPLFETPHPEDSQGATHGMTAANEPACCRRGSTGVVDCQACLDQEYAAFVSSIDQREQEATNILIKALGGIGSSGIPKDQLLSYIDPPSGVDIFSLVDRMCKGSIPLVFWTGYLSIVLVSAVHLCSWTVVVREQPLTRIFPRRWVDIKGMRMTDVWEAGLRAVTGLVVFRPGITQSDLRWRLRSVYDRQETNDLLQYLQDEKFIVRRSDLDSRLLSGPRSDREELGTSLFLGSRHWYHV